MSRGVGAEYPLSYGRSGAHAAPPHNAPVHASAHHIANQTHPTLDLSNQARANIARLFWDLRNALRLTPHQAAAHLLTRSDVIELLETGQFEMLPSWPETARIVMTYAAMAGIDGQPVLNAIADVLRTSLARLPPQQVAPQRLQVQRLRQAGNAIANGAKRLPAGALKQVRERPERAFYAVSMPIAIILMLLNTSVLQAAFSHVPRPVARMVTDVRQFFQEQFAPVHEGLRWIDVDDPRRRRGDKLH
jgi:hypothetical protein